MSAAKDCIVCEALDFWGPVDTPPPQPRRPGSLRCEKHKELCTSCYTGKVTDDRHDDCRACAAKKNLCVVCISVHCAYGEMDTVRLANYPSTRCSSHTNWCAACLEYCTEAAEEVCAKCKRDNLVPRYGREAVDIGQLARDGFLCYHFDNAQPCSSCYCSCYWCQNRYGYESSPRRLPSPPTAQEEMLQRLLQLPRDELWAEVRQMIARFPPLPLEPPVLCPWPLPTMDLPSKSEPGSGETGE